MWLLLVATSGHLTSAASAAAARRPVIGPPLDGVMLFGFLAAIVTLVCWLHHRHTRPAHLGLAVCLAAMATYGFLQGAWPLGFLEAAWSAAAVRRWWTGRTAPWPPSRTRRRATRAPAERVDCESRISRLFGPT